MRIKQGVTWSQPANNSLHRKMKCMVWQCNGDATVLLPALITLHAIKRLWYSTASGTVRIASTDMETNCFQSSCDDSSTEQTAISHSHTHQHPSISNSVCSNCTISCICTQQSSQKLLQSSHNMQRNKEHNKRICNHGRFRPYCKECKGSMLCCHLRHKNRCALC